MHKLSDLFLETGKEVVRLFIEGYNHLYCINNASVDQDKAVERISYAAGEGLQEAQAFMFLMYYEGLFVQRDLSASAEWLAKYKNISYRQLRILKKEVHFISNYANTIINVSMNCVSSVIMLKLLKKKKELISLWGHNLVLLVEKSQNL